MEQPRADGEVERGRVYFLENTADNGLAGRDETLLEVAVGCADPREQVLGNVGRVAADLAETGSARERGYDRDGEHEMQLVDLPARLAEIGYLAQHRKDAADVFLVGWGRPARHGGAGLA